jgi:hypothetical protein
MKRRIPTWIAMAASGLLVAASALAQGGDNAKPDGTAATQSSSSTTAKSSTKHAGAKHAKANAKARHRTTTTSSTSTSSSGTRAAGVDRSLDAAMAQCASQADRKARAECARTAWESKHPA